MTDEQYKKAFRDLRLLFETGAVVDEQDFNNWGISSTAAMRELLREFGAAEALAGRIWTVREKSMNVKVEDYKTGKRRKVKLCAWTARKRGA